MTATNDKRCRLYNQLSGYWPLISPPQDYETEAHEIIGILLKEISAPSGEQERGISSNPSVLELGCGAGHALYHLKPFFSCAGMDISWPMLELGKKLNPEIITHTGDMRTARLNKKFDAVLIFDAIDYMTSVEDVNKTLETAAAHLNPGGIVLIAPTYTSETFIENQSEKDFVQDNEKQITYLSYVHDPDPNDTQFELTLVYLIRDVQTGQLQIETDTHICGLFSQEFWEDCLNCSGFEIVKITGQVEPKDNPQETEPNSATLPYPWFVGRKIQANVKC